MSESGHLPNPPWFYDESPDLTQYFGLIAFISAQVDEGDDPYNPVRYEAWKLGEEFQIQLIKSAQESISEQLVPSVRASIGLYQYQIGPAAEAPPTFLLTLWEQAQELAPHIGTVVDVVEAAGLIWAVKRKINNWVGKKEVKGVYVGYVLPPYALEAICAAHVRQYYEPALPLSAEAFPVDAPMVEHRFPAWEVNLKSLIVVRANQSQYCYVTDSSEKVHLHYKKTGSQVVWLPLPQLSPGE